MNGDLINKIYKKNGEWRYAKVIRQVMSYSQVQILITNHLRDNGVGHTFVSRSVWDWDTESHNTQYYYPKEVEAFIEKVNRLADEDDEEEFCEVYEVIVEYKCSPCWAWVMYLVEYESGKYYPCCYKYNTSSAVALTMCGMRPDDDEDYMTMKLYDLFTLCENITCRPKHYEKWINCIHRQLKDAQDADGEDHQWWNSKEDNEDEE